MDNDPSGTHIRLFFLAVAYLTMSYIRRVGAADRRGLWFYRRRVESIVFFGGISVTGASVSILKFLTDACPPAGASLLHETSGLSQAAMPRFRFFPRISLLPVIPQS